MTGTNFKACKQDVCFITGRYLAEAIRGDVRAAFQALSFLSTIMDMDPRILELH